MRYLVIVAFVLIASITLYARVQDSTSFFPHTVGNHWLYLHSDYSTELVKIVGDSIDNCGYTYVRFQSVTTKKSGEKSLFYWNYKINSNEDTLWGPYTFDKIALKLPLTTDEIFVTQYDSQNQPLEVAKVIQMGSGICSGIQAPTIQLGYGLPSRVTPGTGGLFYKTVYFSKGRGIVWYGTEVEYKRLLGCVIDQDTLGTLDVKNGNDAGLAKSFNLSQNYPNPFNNSTNISFQTSVTGLVKLRIFNSLGQEIAIIVNKELPAGGYSYNFNASNLPTGVYIYKLESAGFATAKKMILLK
ncbi:MAG: T9SS type A sorting domain-containing protein [Ignavibacteria bacterium]|nr:T9SS type A sorting domain-containing protein [Ignavibacteria bacterium]